MIDAIIEAKESFDCEVMPKTRAAIKELIGETDKDFQKRSRLVYLKDRMTDTLCEAWEFLDHYDDDKRREKMLEMLLDGEKVIELIKEVSKIQGEILALRNGDKERRGISEDDIERARQYPFENLIEFKRGMALCPFHADRLPSMHLYREQNRVHCFSCNQSWDTIQFLRERDGLTFREAIKTLC